MMKRLLVLVAAVATLALILGGNALLGGSTPTRAAGPITINMSSYPGDAHGLASAQPFPPCFDNLGDPIACLQLDMDPTNGTGPCNPVDATATLTVGSNHDVAVCLTNAGYGNEPQALNFDLVYDDSLNQCVPKTVPCTDAGSTDPMCRDDNPDANTGVTIWPAAGPSLGSGWDCSVHPPVCDKNTGAPGPGLGRATLLCISTTPGTLPVGDTVSAPIAEVHMKALGAGTDHLSLENVSVSEMDGFPIVVCPGYPGPGECLGGTAVKVPPTPRPGVGGVVNLPPAAVVADSDAPSDDSGWAAGAYAGLAGAGAAAVIVLGAGGWYVGRRRLR